MTFSFSSPAPFPARSQRGTRPSFPQTITSHPPVVMSARQLEVHTIFSRHTAFPPYSPGMITVDATDDAVRVTIPRGEMALEQIEAILRPFRFASLVSGSQLTKDEAMRIAEESKSDWWEKNKQRFGGDPQ